MACLIDPVIINRKYVKIASENDEPVDNYSNREDFYVHVPCRRCINCVNSYMTYWRNRLMYEYEYMSSDARANSYFVTLTFSNNVISSPWDNSIVNEMLPDIKRRFIDRIRKKVGSSPRHWFVTEYGEKFGRLHLHGIFFDCNFDIHFLEEYWGLGLVDFQQLNENASKYCTSYITKGNDDVIVPPHKIQRVFCSPGIGKGYCDDPVNVQYHHPRPGLLNPIMQNSSNFLQAMPRYFKQKIFTDDEREDMTQQYFNEYSDDVIPEPPYRIGKKSFIDYTLYLAECKKYVKQYKKIYKTIKPKHYGFKS